MELIREPLFHVRPYQQEDETRVLELLTTSLGDGPGGQRAPQFFRWKHQESPFGNSFMLIAETDNRIIGLRAFMRWEFVSGDEILHAVRPVDTATHPDYQRRGVFSALTRAALDSLDDEVDFVFNTPNETSLRGYIKLGWEVVGKLPVAIRLRRPVRFARRFRGRAAAADERANRPRVEAETAESALRADGVSLLLQQARPRDSRLTTARRLDYLQWRYSSASLLDYHAIRCERGGRLAGLAIFRVRPRGRLWETTVSEVVVAPDDARTARRLIRWVVGASAVDHLTCSFPAASAAARAARSCGFLPAPGGMTFVVKPLRLGLTPDPTVPRSWALSLGDLEVF